MDVIPNISFTAVGSGREVNLSNLGREAIILITNQNNYEVARNFNIGIRKLVPEADKLLVLNIVDLKAVPRLLRGLVKGYLDSAYQQGFKALPTGFDPKEYILILPDWQGKVSETLNLPGKAGMPGLVILGPQGELRAKLVSDNPLHSARQLLSDLKIFDATTLSD
jgi:hypothetical protein